MSLLQVWRRYLGIDDPDKPARDRATYRQTRVAQAFALNRYDIDALLGEYEMAKQNSMLGLKQERTETPSSQLTSMNLGSVAPLIPKGSTWRL